MNNPLKTAPLPDLLAGGSAVTGEAASNSRQSGQSAQPVEAEGNRLPAGQVLTFSFTEEQRDALAFAALCEVEALDEGHESDELEVQEAIRNLWEARQVLNGGAL